jgi:hypothetical protein
MQAPTLADSGSTGHPRVGFTSTKGWEQYTCSHQLPRRVRTYCIWRALVVKLNLVTSARTFIDGKGVYPEDIKGRGVLPLA